MSSSDFDEVDFFRATALYQDPYPYYEYVRSHGPVWREPHRGVVMVTGFEEAMAVYNDPVTFSSCNTVSGPFTKFPVPLVGDDISAIVAQYRNTLPMNEHMVTMDPPDHTRERALLMRLITPKRLKANEEFMARLAGQLVDEFVADGRCEFISAYSQPFAMLVVAASTFFAKGDTHVQSLEDAARSLEPILGGAAGTLFALALKVFGRLEGSFAEEL